MAQALDEGLRLAGTLSPEGVLKVFVPPLARRMHVIELTELGAEESTAAVLAVIPKIAAYHRLTIDNTLAKAAVERSHSLVGYLPAKAIGLMDAAVSEAALSRDSNSRGITCTSRQAAYRTPPTVNRAVNRT